MRFRVFVTLAMLVVGLGVLAIGAGSASAGVILGSSTDPQTTNIPWLAWAGETVKVSRCFGLGDAGVTEAAFQSSSFNHGSPVIGTFQKVDWSGATDQPPVFETPGGTDTKVSVGPTWDANGGVCFSADVVSEKAGLEQIKFSLTTDLGKWLNFFLGQDVIFQQDLYVIWMWDSTPALTEAGDTGAYQVGDPGGSGSFSPILDSDGVYRFHPGLIQVQVTGWFPLGNDFAGLAPGDKVTLPTDWEWLANHFAEDFTVASTYRGAAPGRWDIHDDNLPTEGHTLGSGCSTLVTSTTIDAVDNCEGDFVFGDPDLGPFSSINGLIGPAFGPFDPIRPLETLLSDGALTPDDAPMPALRVDVSLTNAGADHSVGYLSKADKSAIFNRSDPAYGGRTDENGNPHNLYAPFYRALIPSVVPIIDLNTTSGVEGSIAGNYAEWLTSGLYGLPTSEQEALVYDYWDTFALEQTGGYNNCYDVTGNPISLPDNDADANAYGAGTSVAVYTDEHGQAYVQFNPANTSDGEGIVLTPDGNGRCDVYTGSLIGTATIQATSVYPAQQPADPEIFGQPKVGNVLTKTVNFTPSKTLTCIPKGPNEAYCVETVTDFEGNPVKAPVEFTVESGNGSQPKMNPDPNPWGGYDPSGQQLITWTTDYIDLYTSPTTGQAAIAVHSTTNNCIDVSVENLGTENPEGAPGIFRDFDFNPTAGTVCSFGGGSGGGSGGSGGGSGGSSGGSGSSTGGSTAAPVAVTAPAPTAQAPAATPTKTAKNVKMTLVSAHVITTKLGRFLTVRVNSAAKVAKLRITLVSKNGKSHVVLRTVKTNKVVRVANLKLAPSVKTVRVAVA